MSEQPPKLSIFNEVLYLDRAYKHLSVICLLPSRFNVFSSLNFLININMQLSEMHKQYDRSTSSNWLWCKARASMAPVVSQAQRASFNVFKLLQYKIIGCKHLADRFLHWLRLRVFNPGFCSSIGMRSASVTVTHLLKLSTFNLVQDTVNTCNKTHFQNKNITFTHIVYGLVTYAKSMW
jgi:hypothetical protein